MIYLTAQRVRSLGFQRSAVNTFLHKKDGEPRMDGDPLHEVDAVSQNPGDLMSMSLSLPPGGNAVEALLDVVAGSAFKASELDRILEDGRVGLAGSNEKAWSTYGALARFYAQQDLDVRRTYDELANAARTLFLSPQQIYSPLTIVVERTGDALYYHLDEDSLSRVRRILGPEWRSPRVRVADEVAHDFAVYQGDLREHLIDVLTGMDRSYVRALGGVRFVSEAGGQVGRWPPLVDFLARFLSAKANVPNARFRFASEEDAANFETALRAKRLASSARSSADRLVVHVIFERPNLDRIASLAESSCIEVLPG